MKWVKASEWTPESGQVFVRNIFTRAGGMMYVQELKKLDGLENVEWLDETQPEQNRGQEEKKEKILMHIKAALIVKEQTIKPTNKIAEDLYSNIMNILAIATPSTPQGEVEQAMELIVGCIKRLKDLQAPHINPYNLGDMGEVSSLITTLGQLVSKLPASWQSPDSNQDELWEVVINIIGEWFNDDVDNVNYKGITHKEILAKLKSKYSITRKQSKP